jgi:hypothetical protein
MRDARDQELLDRADSLSRLPLARRVWRVVREGRDPLDPTQISARWNIRDVDVLYAACEPDGAIAEIDYHLSMQPIYPSIYKPVLHELDIDLKAVAVFATIEELVPYGVDVKDYQRPLYKRTQEIGDAFAFLGFDGVLAPSARWPCSNVAIFMHDIPPDRIRVVSSTPINLDAWKQDNPLQERRRRRENER